MKKGKKLLRMTALVGCILLGGGILLSGAGYVGMGFSLKAFTHPQVEKAVRETVCYKDAPQCVEVYAPMGDVVIQGDENAEEPQITAASSVYEVTMQFGALVVQPNEEYRSGSWTTWDWYRLLNLQPWGDYDVTITLPKRMMDSAKATSQLGDVSLSNLPRRTRSRFPPPWGMSLCRGAPASIWTWTATWAMCRWMTACLITATWQAAPGTSKWRIPHGPG